MNEGVVWTFAEDDAAEGIGEVIDVWIAEVSEVVERGMTEEASLTLSLWLERDARDEINCNSFVC